MSEAIQTLAIVGMDICLGGCAGLDRFEQCIHDGLPLAGPEPADLQLTTVVAGALARAQLPPDTRLWAAVLSDGYTHPDILPDALVAQIAQPTAAAPTRNLAEALAAARQAGAQTVLIAVAGEHLAAAVVLEALPRAERRNATIYALLEAAESLDPASGLLRAYQAGAAVGHLEVLDPHFLDRELPPETALPEGLAGMTCALGSLAPDTCVLTALIKTVLCLYYRYLPGWPGWSGPGSDRTGGPFFVPTASVPWFDAQGVSRRACVAGPDTPGTWSFVQLAEAPTLSPRISTYLQQQPHLLVPIATDDPLAALEQLEQELEAASTASEIARRACAQFDRSGTKAASTLALVGLDREGLLREIDYARTGIAAACASGSEWQTPAGSSFTPRPLGREGKVALVYPGAITAYIGLGQQLFRLFPNMHDDPLLRDVYSRAGALQTQLYPRSLKPLSTRALLALEQRLNADVAAMCEVSTGFARLMSVILLQHFGLDAPLNLGYSLGELSMLCGRGLWRDFGLLSERLHRSPLFRDRLNGRRETVRAFWSLPEDLPDDQVWSVHVLLAPAQQVQALVASRERVFVTHINTDTETVIAGDPQVCRQLIAELGCEAFRAPFSHAVHCAPLRLEYDGLVHLHDLPLAQGCEAVFYSAALGAPMPLERAAVTRCLAENLCLPLDFRKLVQRAYADGARLFVEVGPGSNCSRWIGEILKPQPHATIALNRRNTSDHLGLVRALARLVAHQVPLTLAPLYTKLAAFSEDAMTPDAPQSLPAQQSNGLSYLGAMPIAPTAAPPEVVALPQPAVAAQVEALCNNQIRSNQATAALLQMRQDMLMATGRALAAEMVPEV